VAHLLTLIRGTQFDTIYHEHFQYYTLLTAQRALACAGLAVVDVELLPTHGGSIRLWARPTELGGAPSPAVAELLAEERGRPAQPRRATGLRPAVAEVRADLLRFLIDAAAGGQDRGRLRRAGQGQHAAQLLRHPPRPARLHGGPQPLQARPVHPGHPDPDPRPGADRRGPAGLRAVLPWNLRTELLEQLSYVGEWGGQLVFPIPRSRWSSREGRAVLRRLRHADAQRHHRPAQTDAHGGARPLLWHVMRYYAHFGHTEFILCLGYGAHHIKDFFLDYAETASNDFVLRGGKVELLSSDIADWTITFVNTGWTRRSGSGCAGCATWSRARRCSWPTTPTCSPTCRWTRWSTRFRTSDAVAALLAVPPQSAFHCVELGEDDSITGISALREMPLWENGGYFVLRPEIFDYLPPGGDLIGDACTDWPRRAGCSPTRTGLVAAGGHGQGTARAGARLPGRHPAVGAVGREPGRRVPVCGG
jgi:hypothetical protein